MKKPGLSAKIFLALLAGIALGICLIGKDEVIPYFSVVGTLYVNMIKMIMVPLVLSSLVLGIASLDSVRKLGKIGGIAVGVFLFTTAVAVLIGLVVSNVIRPGMGISLHAASGEVKAYPSILDTIVGIVPDNLFASLGTSNMLQIIFIAVLLGVGLIKTGEKGKHLQQMIESVYHVSIVITKMIMEVTPLGVIGLMVPAVAENGIAILIPLAKVIAAFYIAVMLQMIFVYGGLVKGVAKYPLKKFVMALFPAQIVAFTTCSSAAALPVSMQRAQEELGVEKEVAGFVLPLGATVNMDGNALYQGIVALFVAQAYGVELSIPMQAVVILTGAVASIGAAGVPGAGVIVLSTVLLSVGLPIEGVGLIAGIDRILDMGRTLTNITGDAVTAVVVQKFYKRG